MKSMIRMAGVAAVCLAMLLAVTGCESTGSNSAGGDGQLATAQANTCALEGCNEKGDPGISAMVDGKKATFCCQGCKAKAEKE